MFVVGLIVIFYVLPMSDNILSKSPWSHCLAGDIIQIVGISHPGVLVTK